MAEDCGYVEGEEFHSRIGKVYAGKIGRALNKKASGMARVVYAAPHFNPAYADERRGSGRDWATWIFSEEEGTAEGLLSSGISLMMDARFDPGACVGLHTHTDTEEIYYVLEGSIEMSTVFPDGNQETALLGPGDAHAVRRGESHYGRAGAEGVRFICVAARV